MAHDDRDNPEPTASTGDSEQSDGAPGEIRVGGSTPLARPRKQFYTGDGQPASSLRHVADAAKALSATPPVSLTELASASQIASQFAANARLMHDVRADFGALFQQTGQQVAAIVRRQQQAFAHIIRESRQWAELAQAAAASVRLIADDQARVLNEALRAHTQYVSGIVQSASAITAIADTIRSGLDATWVSVLPTIRRLRKALRKQLCDAFLRTRLWPAPSMPYELIERIAKHAAAGNMRAVVLAVWNYYARHNHENLANAIASWWDDAEFAARRPIIETALAAHRQKMYAVTIPTLLAQCEGIAGDFVRSYAPAPGGMAAPKLGKSGQIVQHAIQTAGEVGIVDPDDADMLHVVLIEAVLAHVQTVAFENTDFATQYASIRTRRTLNRHGTLHGIQIKYASAMNSLRCFLLLDALYALRKHARTVSTGAAS